ncbi:MFS transporter [Chloroflexota bacterium]
METERDVVPARRHSWLTVVIANIAHGFAHLNNQALAALWPVLREEFGFGYIGIGLLSVVNQVVVGPIEIVYGVVTRFIRRVRIMAIGTLVAFTGIAGMASSQSYAHLMASGVVRSLGTSPNHPVGGAIMADTFPKARAKAFALYNVSGNIGGWLAPLLVGGMLYFLDWRPILLIMGLPLLLASLLFFSVKEPVPQADAGEGKKRRVRLGLAEYKTVIRDRNAILLGLVMAVGACGRGGGGLHTYLTSFMVDRFGVTAPFAAMFLATYTFGAVAGPLSMAWFADRTSPRLVLRISLALSAAFSLLFLVPKTPGIPLGVVIFLAGFFISSRGILTQSMLVSMGPKDVRIDTLLSLYGAMGAATGPLWTLITGVIVRYFGIPPALMVAATSYVSGIVILSFIKLSPMQEVTDDIG